MFFRRIRPSRRPPVRLVLPRPSRPLPEVPPLPEGWQEKPGNGAEPDADEIKVRERLLALLGEVARWPR
ncbi:hypothetical protein GTY20_09105 [Streptomyces sp. SID4946]|uniref:hypothetical protein n=1 Tax=Streptomyces sp. LamerLS-31b TaxID=1839765 RepID=UPI00081ECE55|nr:MULTISPECIES: hypothetical protein [unclassified Streptomyces]MYQ91474.1 hypothetical protein [Streptomyces sp. SID4946]SCF67780.1 hypothetical protein GA0115256_111326 [Streptomyces sp. DconLS]SCF79533.1 hypothetical protein GA0115258_112588 [Streptomyces sp. LamerLS-31b]